MSEDEAQHEPVVEPARCPRCGAELAPDQEWCLSCGTAARTVVAATPRWKLPIALVAIAAVLCGAAVAWALVELTDNDAEVKAATTPTITKTVPLDPAVTATTPTTTTPGSGVTTPPATTTPPAATTPPVATAETLTAPTAPSAETIPAD